MENLSVVNSILFGKRRIDELETFVQNTFFGEFNK